MATTDYENLRVERDAPLGRIELASTSDFNSLNPTMGEELVHAVTELSEDESIRCLVLTGTDGVFCAGADLAGLAGDERDAPELRRLASSLHDAILQLHQAETPLVVGINGVAAGAGFSMALAGDVVVMSDEARLEYAYGRIGLTGDGGSTFWLPRLVGLRRAKEIALLDEPIDPDYAVGLGLVTESVPAAEFDARVTDYAERLASGPTAAFGATKRLLTESFDRGLAGQMAAETDAIARATHTEDYERGHDAFFEKGDPEFVGQ
ncbi:enoyl-CoA hydratase/isomerase family protein [Halomarina ordinaria]|uniref:Enoyl-CoA hydratase/isomerase family protein n=1 Tax=Halomarina ordinaria TaxID=3033939 RepID=A0ABD5UAW6_9EURY|nr:enoyl-CoA hydratase-related protein [Halomarina sp. PSRA2]